jgi:hypothetical protein
MTIHAAADAEKLENSILCPEFSLDLLVQGEGIVYGRADPAFPQLIGQGISIHFAHRRRCIHPC